MDPAEANDMVRWVVEGRWDPDRRWSVSCDEGRWIRFQGMIVLDSIAMRKLTILNLAGILKTP
jgi:hypothetical protein